ncbi:MAG: WXG100 family type VII secretion target [Labedaea sp.]
MERIAMDFGSVSELEETMGKTADEVERILSELRTKLHSTLASWEGGASEKYRTIQAEWDNAANDLHDVLRRLRRLVFAARGNHSAALEANLSMWRRR